MEGWFQGSGLSLTHASKLMFWCRSFQRLKADISEVFVMPAYDDCNLIERKRAQIIFMNCRRYIYLKGYWRCFLAVCPV